jgi:hypothetical protein
MSRTKNWLACAAVPTLFVASPANATIFAVEFSGMVENIQFGVPDNTIVVGDRISASFLYDANEAVLGNTLPLGGGLASIYSIKLRNYTLSVGRYFDFFQVFDSTLYYHNDVFNQDAFGFGVQDTIGLPFNSIVANIQFQARGNTSLLDNISLPNGLPFDRADERFFAGFSDGTNQVIVSGTAVANARVISAIPEHGTWAMMMTGLALVGYSLRKRRSFLRQILTG